MRLIALVGLVVLALGCGDTKTRGAALSGVSPWTYRDGLKSFPPDSSATTFVTAEGKKSEYDPVANEFNNGLIIDCDATKFPHRRVSVATPYDENRPGYVVIQMDSAKPDTTQWTTLMVPKLGATDLSIPGMLGDSILVPHFLARLTKAKRLTFVYSNGGQPDTMVFRVDSLAPQLAKMDSVCGPRVARRGTSSGAQGG